MGIQQAMQSSAVFCFYKRRTQNPDEYSKGNIHTALGIGQWLATHESPAPDLTDLMPEGKGAKMLKYS